MNEGSIRNFGILIAYLLPGFVALWGVGYVSETVRSWLGASPAEAPTVGGFLYVTLASVAAGLTVSAVRWAVVDRVHAWTGIRPPEWDFAALRGRVAAFSVLVEHHYRHYQFYANMVVALCFTYGVRALSPIASWSRWEALGFLAVVVIFWVTSRDTLRKYHTRGAQILQERECAVIPDVGNPLVSLPKEVRRWRTEFTRRTKRRASRSHRSGRVPGSRHGSGRR